MLEEHEIRLLSLHHQSVNSRHAAELLNRATSLMCSSNHVAPPASELPVLESVVRYGNLTTPVRFMTAWIRRHAGLCTPYPTMSGTIISTQSCSAPELDCQEVLLTDVSARLCDCPGEGYISQHTGAIPKAPCFSVLYRKRNGGLARKQWHHKSRGLTLSLVRRRPCYSAVMP